MESKLTIMVIDDQGDIVELVKTMLVLEGFEVLEGWSAEDALHLIHRYPRPVHLLLTDVRMSPGMNGYDLSEALLQMRPDLKVIFMSGFSDDKRVGEMVVAEKAGFLRKPFSRKELLHKIRETLALESQVR